MRKKVYKLEYDGNQLKTITDDLSEFKILNAYMILNFKSDLNALSSCSISYKDEENGNSIAVDTLTNIQAGQTLKVNVFEMMKSIQSKKTNLFITFSSNVVDPDADNKLFVECLSLAEYQENGSSEEIDIGDAGTLSINLLSGTPTLKTNIVPSDNNKLFLAIDAIYNGVETELPGSLGLPKSWKLNINQFLIKDTNSENLKFTYVDENGNSQIIEEKYYYVDDNNKKVFIDKGKLSVNLDGQLIYKFGGKEYKVATKLEAPSGINLVSSIKDVQGAELVDFEPEEMTQAKEQIKQLEQQKSLNEKSFQTYQKQLCLLLLAKSGSYNNLVETYADYIDDKETTANKWDDSYSKPSVDEKSDFYHKQAFYRNYKAEFTCEDLSNILKDHYNDLKLFNENEQKTFYEEMHKELSEASQDRQDYFSNKITDDSTNFANNIVLNDYNLLNFDIQINNYKEQISYYYDQIDEINEKLNKLNHQLEIYEMQVPVHYLYRDSDVIYGFGKTNDENIFRLILITDSYENMIFISYDSLDDNKIANISNSKEQLISFVYKEVENDSKTQILNSIIDYRDRQVSFDNENGNLKTITHVDGTQSHYYYVADKLTYIINQNGIGSKIFYEEDSIIVQSLSGMQDVVNGDLHYKEGFDFSDSDNFDSFLDPENKVVITCQGNRTSVTNEKNKTLTYLFDIYGNTRLIYESDFNSDENTTIKNIQEFTYTNNKKSEKVSSLPYSENFLSDVCFNNESIEMVDMLFPSDDVFCGDGAYSYQIPSCDKKHTMSAGQAERIDTMSMSDAMLAKLEDLRVLDEIDSIDEMKNHCSHRTFVVSGFAKASSLFVVSDNSDDYAENVKARKFAIVVKVTYVDGNIESFEKSFDWTIKEKWQYCSVPITLKDKEVSKVECQIDYSNNSGDIEYTDLQFCQATFESVEYDSQGRPVFQKSGHSEWGIAYDYDGDTNNVTQKTYTSKISGKSYTYLYTYNKNGKLLRTEDVDRGVIEENVYDDNGNLTKTITYHKDEPAIKFYQEQTLDENGNVLADKNEFGKETSKYEYVQNTGLINTVEDENGNKIAYGYDAEDTLVNMTAFVEGINNTNVYGYSMDFLTSFKHNGFAIEYDYDCKGRTTKIKVAGAEYLDKAYSELTETTHLANEEKYEQTFDNNGNVLETYYFKNNDDNQGTLVSKNIYDTYGNVVKTIDENGVETKYLINNFGQTYKTEGSQHSQTFSVENTFDDNHDKVISSVITIGEQEYIYCYSYSQTPNPTLENIELPNNDTQWLSYDKLGRISNVMLGLENKEFSYLTVGDHTSNLISKLDFAVNKIKKDNLTYKYDAKGNIIEIRQNNVLLARYKYDGLSRLLREDNKNFNKTYVFTYDEGGNITSRTEYDFTLVENLDSLSGTCVDYTYSMNGWRDQLKSYNGENFEYDFLGNPTTYRNKTLCWSHGRQLDKFADIAEYKYNASGIRISKAINVSNLECNCGNEKCDCNGKFTTKFYINGNKIIRQYDCCNDLTFYYGAEGVVGFHIKNNLIDADYYYKKNAQNDIIGIYSIDGIEIAKYEYDAWGNFIAKYLQDDGTYGIIESDYKYNDTTLINRFITYKNPFRYRSYYYDFETNLYYLNSRYYDPKTGRFINADDISIVDITSMEMGGINLYSYTLNNPVNYQDSSGYFLFTAFIIGLIVGATVGATIGGVYAYNKAKASGATGWELFGWTLLGIVGGGIVGGAVGGAIGTIFPAVNTFLASSFSIGISGGGLVLAGGSVIAGAGIITVSAGAVITSAGVLAGLGLVLLAEHTKNKRPSTRNKHEEGQAKRKRDQGGEKGDARRKRWRKLSMILILPSLLTLLNYLL